MCSEPKNSYLSRRTYYSDTSAGLVKARGGVLDMFKSFTTTSEQPVNVSELLRSPAPNTKSNYENTDQIREKHDVTRLLSEFWII